MPNISQRLRIVRQTKGLTQSDIERRTGLLRSFLSRLENGHATPTLKTLETLARAFELPLYELFYEVEVVPEVHRTPMSASRRESRDFEKLRLSLARMKVKDRTLLLDFARNLVKAHRRRTIRSSHSSIAKL